MDVFEKPAWHLQLMYSIGLILLGRQNSLPITDVIVYPSLSWMSLRSRLIVCLKRVGLLNPLPSAGTQCFLPGKKMVVCDYVWISAS